MSESIEDLLKSIAEIEYGDDTEVVRVRSIQQALYELRTLRAEAAKVPILEEQLLNSKKSNQSLIEDLTEAEPEAEAWRAVRDEFVKPCRYPITRVVADQIARLDAMKEGKSNGM